MTARQNPQECVVNERRLCSSFYDAVSSITASAQNEWLPFIFCLLFILRNATQLSQLYQMNRNMQVWLVLSLKPQNKDIKNYITKKLVRN